MGEVYFTSDQHYGHVGILLYAGRQYESVTAMNEDLIERHNSVVKSSDDVYMLGDLAFMDPTHVVPRLNGRKHIVLGNHDHRWKAKLHALPFNWIKETYELKVRDLKIWLSHYPHLSWPSSFHGSLHFHGHCHGKVPMTTQRVDVGVDVWDYRPVTLDQILERAAQSPPTYNKDAV